MFGKVFILVVLIVVIVTGLVGYQKWLEPDQIPVPVEAAKAPACDICSALKKDLAVQAIQHHHKRVRFLSTIELVNLLEQEKQLGKRGRMAHRLVHTDLVILDELGCLPFNQAGGALLFHLISKLYEKTSIIITTNLSFAE